MRLAAIDRLTMPAPIDVLELRAWARAYLWSIGELELHEAVDALQAFAVAAGLVDEDQVQRIIAGAFSPFREAEQ